MTDVSATATDPRIQFRVRSAGDFAIIATRAREHDTPGFTQQVLAYLQSTLNGSTEAPAPPIASFWTTFDEFLTLGGIPRKAALQQAAKDLTT